MFRLFRVYVATRVAALLASELALLAAAYSLATFLFFGPEAQVFLFADNGWLGILVVVGCLLTGIYFHDLYTQLSVGPRELLQQVGVISGVAFLTQSMLLYLGLDRLVIPAGPMITGTAIVIPALIGWRILFSRVLMPKMHPERVLFVGNAPITAEIARQLREHPEKGLKPVGFLDESNPPGPEALGGIADLHDIADRFQPARVVIGMQERRASLPMIELLELRLAGVRIEDALTMYELAFERLPAKALRPSQFIFSSSELAPSRFGLRMRAITSLAIAAAAAVVFAPVMIIVALLVRLTSPGPVLYRQQRVGERNRVFTLYKFRSMVQDAEAGSGAVWAKRNDPRVTPLGRWLRKLRFDELPQLFNVLKGDMSIVGPRPERPEFVADLEKKIPYYRQRHAIKPGITGWAQIKHKYGDTIDDATAKLEYDLYYIKNLAPALDAAILFHTVKVMLLSRGAQ